MADKEGKKKRIVWTAAERKSLLEAVRNRKEVVDGKLSSKLTAGKNSSKGEKWHARHAGLGFIQTKLVLSGMGV